MFAFSTVVLYCRTFFSLYKKADCSLFIYLRVLWFIYIWFWGSRWKVSKRSADAQLMARCAGPSPTLWTSWSTSLFYVYPYILFLLELGSSHCMTLPVVLPCSAPAFTELSLLHLFFILSLFPTKEHSCNQFCSFKWLSKEPSQEQI